MIPKSSAASKPKRSSRPVRKYDLTAMGAFVQHLPGHRVLAAFVDEFERGVIPRSKTTEVIVQAFRAILADKDMDPAAALRIKRQRGQKLPISFGDLEENNRQILRYIERKIDAQTTHTDKEYRQARQAAIAAAAEEFGPDTRTIERAWMPHEIADKSMRQWRAALDVIDRTMTPAEKRRMRKHPLAQVYEHALRKAAAKIKTEK